MQSNSTCRGFLVAVRAIVKAKREERIDKRYNTGGYFLAPNDKEYKAHCGFCAEVDYLQDIYNS